MPSRRLRQFYTGVALIAYLLSIWGVPMPTASETSDHSIPFICQGHACGCRSADQCWHNCCCYSAAERLAWAETNRVAIPSQLQAALIVDSRRGNAKVAAHDCCSEPAAACCAHDASSAPVAEKPTACGQQHRNETKTAKVTVRWVLGIEAQKCQGISTLWVTSGACLPLVVIDLWQFDDALRGQIELADVLSPSTSLTPPERPPCA